MDYRDIIYRHSKGHFYRIIHFGLDEGTLEPEVAYRQCDRSGKFQPGQTWHRSCTEFFDGRFRAMDDFIEEADDVVNIFAEPPAPPVPATYQPFPGATPVAIVEEDPEVADTDDFRFASQRAEPPLVLGTHHVKPRRPNVDFPMRDVLAATERQMASGAWPEDGFGDGKL